MYKVDLKRVITHELLHIYEIFNRIIKGSKKDLQWALSKNLMNIRDKYKSKFIQDFIYLIYLSLDARNKRESIRSLFYSYRIKNH
jgi:hypothetical protein